VSAWAAAAEELAAAGCGLVTGVPTDEMGLLDAAALDGRMLALAVRDQRVAAAAAAGFTAAGGMPSVVAMATGPAFANAVAALTEVASLALPLVAVTTSVPAATAGRGAFQELDQRALAAAFAKWFHRVERAADLRWALRRATHLARNGCPGVTVVEVAPEACEGGCPAPDGAISAGRLRSLPAPDALEAAAAAMARAERPVIVAGGGARAAGAGPALARLALRWGAPVLTTAAGRGVLDETRPPALGLVGLYAAPPVAGLLGRADLVLAVGTRLEETARMGWDELGAAVLVHVDADPAAFGRPYAPAVALLGDAALTASALGDRLAVWPLDAAAAGRRGWCAEVDAVRREAETLFGELASRSTAAAAVAAAGRVFGPEASYTFENGLHDIWAYHWPLLRVGGGAVVVPGEQTMMGFGMPAAIGAALAVRGRPVVAFSGDGAFSMNPGALAALAQLGLPVTVVVFDNGGFGWPRFSRRGEPDAAARLTRFDPPLPPAAVAASLGVWSAVADDAAAVPGVLEGALAANRRGGPAVVVVPVRDDDVPPGILRVFGA
jgi:acetolactate synthase-1/2/3 large subunit